MYSRFHFLANLQLPAKICHYPAVANKQMHVCEAAASKRSAETGQQWEIGTAAQMPELSGSAGTLGTHKAAPYPSLHSGGWGSVLNASFPE